MDGPNGRPNPASGPPADAEGGTPPGVAALLGAAAKGDEAAWRGIVDLYARRVYALARSRLGGGRGSRVERGAGPFDQGHDAAEEVTQSVFVTVATKLSAGEYTEQGRFEPWLFRIAMNRIRDEVRRLKRSADPVDPETFAGVEGREAGPEGIGADQLAALRRAMDRLSDADREIVELRHHAGLSFKQMADLLDEPLGTLLARHHRALRKLKDLILSSGQPDPFGPAGATKGAAT